MAMRHDPIYSIDLRLNSEELQILLAVIEERIDTFESDKDFVQFAKALDEVYTQIQVSSSDQFDMLELIDGLGYSSTYQDDDDWNEESEALYKRFSEQVKIFALLSNRFNDLDDLFGGNPPRKTWFEITRAEYEALKEDQLAVCDAEIYPFTGPHAMTAVVDMDNLDIETIDQRYPGLGERLNQMLSRP